MDALRPCRALRTACDTAQPCAQRTWTSHLPSKVSLDPLSVAVQRTFPSSASLFPGIGSHLQYYSFCCNKPGGFSSGREKLLRRFPLSPISTARPLAGAVLGTECIGKEMGRFQCPALPSSAGTAPLSCFYSGAWELAATEAQPGTGTSIVAASSSYKQGSAPGAGKQPPAFTWSILITPGHGLQPLPFQLPHSDGALLTGYTAAPWHCSDCARQRCLNTTRQSITHMEMRP